MRSTSATRYNFLLAITLTLLSSVIFVNVIVDPFQRDGLSPLQLPRMYNAYLTFQNEQRLWLMLKYRRQPSDNILIGDSRTARLGHPDGRNFTEAGIDNFFNFSFGGAGREEMLDVARFVRQHNPHVRSVIMMTAFEQNIAGNFASRFAKLEPLATNPLKYYSSLHVLDFSVRDLLMADMTTKPGAHTRRVAIYEWIKAALSRLWPGKISIALGDAFVPSAFAQRWINPQMPEFSWEYQLGLHERDKSNFHYDRTKSEALASQVASMRQQGIRVVFVDPPTHADLHAIYSRYGLDSQRATHLGILAAAAPVVELFGSSADRMHFDDPVHPLDTINRGAARAVASILYPDASQANAPALPQDAVAVRCPREPAQADRVQQLGDVTVMTGENCRLWVASRDLTALRAVGNNQRRP